MVFKEDQRKQNLFDHYIIGTIRYYTCTCKHPSYKMVEMSNLIMCTTYLASLSTGVNTRSTNYPVGTRKSTNVVVNCPEVLIITKCQ